MLMVQPYDMIDGQLKIAGPARPVRTNDGGFVETIDAYVDQLDREFGYTIRRRPDLDVFVAPGWQIWQCNLTNQYETFRAVKVVPASATTSVP